MSSSLMNNYLEQQSNQVASGALVTVNAADNITLEEFKKYVERWLELDNFIRKAQEVIKQKKKGRDEISKTIIMFMCKYNIEDLNTKEGRIRCRIATSKAPVSQKVIKQRITDYFGTNDEQKQAILNKIYEEREEREKVTLRRLKIT